MTLQTSGPISMNDILNEFGTSKPLSMSQLYRGGQYVSSSTLSVPASGTISLKDFYGVSKAFTFDTPITSNMMNFDLRSILIARGWDELLMVDVTIYINSGVVIYSNATSIPAMTIGTFPPGSIIRIINRGHIVGMGGSGGSRAGNNGKDGGTAISLSYLTTISNSGIIGGGGGGGAGAKVRSTSSNVGGGGGQSGLIPTTELQHYRPGFPGTFEGPGNGGAADVTSWEGGRGGTWGEKGKEFVNNKYNSFEKFSSPGEGGLAIDGMSFANIVQYGTILGRVWN